MPENSAQSVGGRLTGVQWAICAIAAIGFAFDTYELLMLPLIAQDALRDLAGIRPGTPEFARWFAPLVLCAGGLRGNFRLTRRIPDRLARPASRADLEHSALCLFRVCRRVQHVAVDAAGVPLHDVHRSVRRICRRRGLAGRVVRRPAATRTDARLYHRQSPPSADCSWQSFTDAGQPRPHLPALSAAWAPFWGTIAEPHAPWRYTLLSGLIPALPLIVIRPWLPESPKWRAQKKAGLLRRPSIAELFSPRSAHDDRDDLDGRLQLRRAFGAIQMVRQIVPRMPEVRAETRGKPVPVQKRIEAVAASDYTKVQEIGGLVGRVLLALLAIRIVSRRNLLRVFLLPGLVAMPLIFLAFGSVRTIRSCARSTWRGLIRGEFPLRPCIWPSPRPGFLPWPNSASGATISRGSIRRTFAERARASRPTWAGG